jgi:hypothetical protein
VSTIYVERLQQGRHLREISAMLGSLSNCITSLADSCMLDLTLSGSTLDSTK